LICRSNPTPCSESWKRVGEGKNRASSTQECEINLPFITADQTGPKHIQKKLTRAKLEQLTDDLFQRTVKPVSAIA
jgi:molecular chaperone DnaK